MRRLQTASVECDHDWRTLTAGTTLKRCRNCAALGRPVGFGGRGSRIGKTRPIACQNCGAPARHYRTDFFRYLCDGCNPPPPGNLRSLAAGDFSPAEAAALRALYAQPEATT